MPVGLSDFKDLLEYYFLAKYDPENPDNVSKKEGVEDIKKTIYNKYLNEKYGGRVMGEFFDEVDKFESEYIQSAGIDNSILGDATTGHALSCSIAFTKEFKRDDLLKSEIRDSLLRARKKKISKKHKSKKHKSKKHKSKKRKSNKRKSKKRKNKNRKSKK